MDIGATWLSCQVPVGRQHQEVLVGCSNLADYLDQDAYLGSIVGRYANRIAQGRYVAAGEIIQLDVNEGVNTLHGGTEGFDQRRWQIEEATASSVLFSLISADGDQGFPGELHCSVRYTVREDNSVELHYLAKTSALTPVNLTSHAYFNLEDAEQGADCLSHQLQIHADQYVPVDEHLIPTGALALVEGTEFDYRELRQVDELDHAFLFSQRADALSRPQVTLRGSDGVICLEIATNKPAIQIYTGRALGGIPNRAGGSYAELSGIALETQFLPDSVNHPEWPEPSCLLSPDDSYDYTTAFRFKVSDK
jgi:aldose 1-epimerase